VTIPLWVLWALVVALALPALLGSMPGREGRRRRLARLWVPALVALAVTVVATIDAARVTEDELYDATDRAARTLSGTLSGTPSGSAMPERIEVAVEERLGHPVAVSGAVSGPWSSEATDEQREERYVVSVAEERGVGEAGSDPAVCLVARVSAVIGADGGATGLSSTLLQVQRGRCEE
jgi:hypothetical protein